MVLAPSCPPPPGSPLVRSCSLAYSKVGKSFGFLPPGWVHQPVWAGVGGGFESQQGHHLPCRVSSDNCLPSLSWGVFISGRWAWLVLLGWWKDGVNQRSEALGLQANLSMTECVWPWEAV